jgi:hypothetical protein
MPFRRLTTSSSRARRLLGPAAWLAAGALTLAVAHPSYAQEPATVYAPGLPGAPGVPVLTTNPGVLGSSDVDPVTMADTPIANGRVTATWIDGGSSGSAGTGAGSDAPTASGE